MSTIPTVRLRVFTHAGALDKELVFNGSSLVDAAVNAVLAALPMGRSYHVIESAQTEHKRRVMWFCGRANDNEQLPKGSKRRPYIEKIVRTRLDELPKRRCSECSDGVCENNQQCYTCGSRGEVADL